MCARAEGSKRAAAATAARKQNGVTSSNSSGQESVASVSRGLSSGASIQRVLENQEISELCGDWEGGGRGMATERERAIRDSPDFRI